MWKRDGVSGREMEYLGAKWCEWKGNEIFVSRMEGVAEMEYVEARWCKWKGNGIFGSEMV
jgi:hypothetical protein